MPRKARGDQHAFSDKGSPLVFVEHEAIIQTLDRESNGKYLGKEAFEGSEDDWNDAHLIFAQDHPDPDKFDKDPDAELKRIKGRMVNGTARDARIELTGHPTLRITFDLDDEEIEKGIADGNISTSNCFFCKDDGKKLTGTVRPHHILFFYENGKAQPGDRGVLILNQASITLTDAESQDSTSGEPNEEDTMTDSKELEGQLAIARKEAADAKQAFTQLQSEKGELDKALSAKDAEIGKLKDEIKAFKEKAADTKFNAFVSKHVPPGMVEGEKLLAFRKRYDEDPVALMDEILEFRAENGPAGGEGAEPMEFTARKSALKEKEIDAELRKHGASSVNIKEA